MGVASELSLPASVGDDGHRMTAALYVVRGMQQPAKHGLNAQHVEIISADFKPPGTGILSPAAADVHGCEVKRSEAAQHRIAITIIFVVGIGVRGYVPVRSVPVEEDPFILVVDSKGPEDNSVHQ